MRSVIIILSVLWVSVGYSHTVEDDLKEIYNELVYAIGDKQKEFPELIVLEREKNIASYRSYDNTILIERKALNICDQFGNKAKAAAAFLIAHELTHFYRKHDWNGQTFFLADHHTLASHKEEETEADTYGAFICYLAGYNTTSILPELLEKLYMGYNLEPNLRGYPGLEERKSIGESVCRQVDDLIDLYESANFLMVASFYEEAYYLYQYLLQFVKTKEMYNNQGLANLAQALSLESESKNFIYPVEVDLEIPFRKPFRQDAEKLLDEAISGFKAAIQFDRGYHTAYLNLTIALTAKGEYENAIDLISQLESASNNKKKLGQLEMLKGIIQASIGNPEVADKHFKISSSLHRGLKKMNKNNQKILRGKSLHLQKLAGPSKFEDDRLLEKQEIENSIILDHSDPLFPVKALLSSGDGASTVSVTSGPQSVRVSLFRTKHSCTKRNILVGSSADELQASYIGETEKNLFGRTGNLIYYPEFALAFSLNLRNTVSSWALID